MATIPNPRTWTASEQATAAKLNTDVRDSLNFYLGTPHCILRKTSGAQVIATNTEAAVSWDIEVVDSDNGHSNITNNTRYTAQTAGWYHVVASLCAQAGGSAGMREIVIRKNGNGTLRFGRMDFWPVPSGTNGHTYLLTTAAHVNLLVGDYVELLHFQSSGTNTTIFESSIWGGRSEFEIRWVRA